MAEVVKVRDDATSSANEKGWHARLFELHISLLNDVPESLKRKESTKCDTEVVSRKAADAKRNKNNLVDGLR